MSVQPLKVDGLTVAEELIVLHNYPRPKKDMSLGNAPRTGAVGAFADLVLARSAELYEVELDELDWLRRTFYNNNGAHRYRLRPVAGSPPTGDDLLDSVLQRLPALQRKDLAQCMKAFKKLWLSFRSRLQKEGVLTIVGLRQPDFLDPSVERKMQARLKHVLSAAGEADAHTAAVLVLARAQQLFRPGSGERGLIDPIDDDTLNQRVAELAGLPSLAQVQKLARGSAQFRIEREQASRAGMMHGAVPR